jgi:hypothetical protein
MGMLFMLKRKINLFEYLIFVYLSSNLLYNKTEFIKVINKIYAISFYILIFNIYSKLLKKSANIFLSSHAGA